MCLAQLLDRDDRVLVNIADLGHVLLDRGSVGDDEVAEELPGPLRRFKDSRCRERADWIARPTIRVLVVSESVRSTAWPRRLLFTRVISMLTKNWVCISCVARRSCTRVATSKRTVWTRSRLMRRSVRVASSPRSAISISPRQALRSIGQLLRFDLLVELAKLEVVAPQHHPAFGQPPFDDDDLA